MVRLIERLKAEQEYRWGRNTAPIQRFLQTYPAYEQYEWRSLRRAFQKVQEYFDRCELKSFNFYCFFFEQLLTTFLYP